MTERIQVAGCKYIEDGIEPFVSDDEAEVYGVYHGEPGDFNWIADFRLKDDALWYGKARADLDGIGFDDQTKP